MKKIPNKVNILGKTYTITLVEDETRVAHDGSRTPMWGEIIYEKRSIRLYNNENKEDLYESYIHEVTHGCIEEAQLNRFLSPHVEDITSILSQVIIDTLIRNGIA